MVQSLGEPDVSEQLSRTAKLIRRVAVWRRYECRRQHVLDYRTLRQQAVVLKNETDLLVAKCGKLSWI